jgi:putative DNA primase/helicase
MSHFAVFARLSEGGEDLMKQVNEVHVDPKLDDREVHTIWRSVGSGEYKYRCDLQGRCNRHVCTQRKYGIRVAHGLEPYNYSDLQKRIGVDLPIPSNDSDRAALIKEAAEERMKYVVEPDQWVTLDDVQGWVADNDNNGAHLIVLKIGKQVSALTDRIYNVGDGHPLWSHRKRLRESADSMLNESGSTRALKRAGRSTVFRTHMNEWNADPYLIGAPNGVFDLRTGAPVAGNPLVTKRIRTPFDPGAPKPPTEFLKTLRWGLNDEEDLQVFVQKIFGMCLSGLLTRQYYYFFGPAGFNGKSLICGSFGYMLGEYTASVDINTILASRMDTGKDKGRADLGKIHGSRCNVTSELPKGRVLDEQFVKSYTGGSEEGITYRLPYGKEQLELHPTGKLIVHTNHMPHLQTHSRAILKRTVVVPWLGQVPSDADRGANFVDHVKVNEAAGILAWAYEGFRMAQEEGMDLPAACDRALDEFRKDDDPVLNFLLDTNVVQICAADEHEQPHGSEAFSGIKKPQLWDAFQRWCGKEKRPVLGSKSEFYEQVGRVLNGMERFQQQDVRVVKTVWGNSRGVEVYKNLFLTHMFAKKVGMSPDGRPSRPTEVEDGYKESVGERVVVPF